MTRVEYMKELEYLLQDIQDEEKEDALQYYRDYFEEAGPDKEEDIIKELGSPERIASMIRCDIAGHLEQGGEFTESGYQDERFRDPNYQLARHCQLPEPQAPQGREGQDFAGGQSGGREKQEQKTPRTSRTLKVVLWILLILAASPIIIGVGGGFLGLVAGAGGILIAIMAVTGIITIAVLIAGIAIVPVGIVTIFSHPLSGIMTVSTGLAFIGLGLLFLALSLLFYGRFLPWLFRGILDGLSRLFHRGRCAR